MGLGVMKKACSSPAALVAVIAYTAAALFNLFSAIGGSSGILGYLYRIADALDVDLDYFYYASRGVSVAVGIIGMIPTVLTAVGLWITFASAANKMTAGMKTGGLTLVKVILIINFVFICIAFAAVEVVLSVAAASFSDSYFDSSVVGIMVGVIIGIAVGMTPVILLYVKAVKTVNTMSLTARTGYPSDKVSVFVAVMAFIMGGFKLILLFVSSGVLAKLSGLCSVTASIAFGVFLISYRGKMKAAVSNIGYENVRQPVYAQPTSAYAVPDAPEPQSPNYYYSTTQFGNETTVLSDNVPQQLVTCSECGGHYETVQGQKCQCPYCGNIERENDRSV